MVILLCLENNRKIVQTYAMIDSRATSFAFIDEEFAASHGLSHTPLQQNYELEVFNGRTTLSGAVTDLVVDDMIIDQHTETQAPFFFIKLRHYPIVLGIPWLRKHNITTKWQKTVFHFYPVIVKTTVFILPPKENFKELQMFHRAPLPQIKTDPILTRTI